MKTNKTFAGIEEQYAAIHNANCVVLPVPFDGTSTWGKGADKGPDAIFHAAENMELYDIETASEPYKKGVAILDSIYADDVEKMVLTVYEEARNQFVKGKFLSILGGEHSVSIGAIRACNEVYENLTVVQLDAHLDLRKSYNGSEYNHACAMHEASKTCNLIQVGIRSADAGELKYMNKDQVFFAHEISSDDYWIDNVVDQLTDNVYITIDLDAFDPAIMPATGTPEPGGLFWYETLELLKAIYENANVVGFDIVELCPNSNSRSSEFLAAKLMYKNLAYKFNSNDAGYDEQDKEDDEKESYRSLKEVD